MTVEEIIKELQEYPLDAKVYITTIQSGLDYVGGCLVKYNEVSEVDEVCETDLKGIVIR